MHFQNFVNIVNIMNVLMTPKQNNWSTKKDQEYSQFSEKGLYVREDDQDWGSSGMNDILRDPE